jgi:hypothetical protein
MPGYWVTIRGIAEQEVHVEAENKAEARRKAATADFDDAADAPDFIQNDDGTWRTWAAQTPVEEDTEPHRLLEGGP